MEEILKELPNNIEAEQAVLGCIINSKDRLQEVDDILSINDFYVDRHKRLFKAIKDLVARDVNVDLITLLEELRQQKNIDKL
jgi:replicative DNA helicase